MIMNYLKISIGIFLALAASRFIPHPPNFTSLLALSFYVPAILGLRYIPALILSFAITDLFIGLHGLTLFTWGSVIFIGLISISLSLIFPAVPRKVHIVLSESGVINIKQVPVGSVSFFLE